MKILDLSRLKTKNNSLPNNKILVLTKLKAFADSKFNVAKILISVFDRAINIVGKRENVDYQHFLLFPQCFQKLSVLWSLKVGISGKKLNELK